MENTEAVLLADAPDALVKVCGITLLERLLRTLQRLGFRHATVVSKTSEPIAAELSKPSWARGKLVIDLAAEAPAASERTLTVPANIYCDARLLRALCDATKSAALVDSNPPEFAHTLIANPCGPAIEVRGSDKIDIVDAAKVDGYIVSMRRHLRPVCIQAAQDIARAERVVLDSAQKGTLDIPARVHAPIEKWIVSHLCKTKITPNQITLFTAIISAGVTLQFAFGWLVPGTLLALLVGVLDGVDGKQARVKVETTELGEWEHKVDAVLEASWWLALGLHFHLNGDIPGAPLLAIGLLFAHVLDGVARRFVQRVTGRSVDDLTPADRALRLVAGRRNIYTWLFAIFLAFGAPAAGFVTFCIWGIASCAIHVVRAFFVRANREGWLV